MSSFFFGHECGPRDPRCASNEGGRHHAGENEGLGAGPRRLVPAQRNMIRVVQLSPDQWGGAASALTQVDIDGLRALDVEVLAIDARRSDHSAEPGNVRILADYFDFS